MLSFANNIRAIDPESGCGYLVLLTLRWSIRVDLFHHVKEDFCYLLPPFVLGYKSAWKIKCRRFQCSLECFPGTILWFLFYYFHIFVLFTYISDPQAPTLASGIFVEAGPLQPLL